MKGLLLINLGSPQSTDPKDVKTYLDEFLMDERVIDIAYWKRWLLVKGIILNTRPKKSAKAYSKVWTEEGSPLIATSHILGEDVQALLGDEAVVDVGMRYGEPSIKNAMIRLRDKGVTEMLVIPLYPQHAMSSTETVIEKFKDNLEEMKWNVNYKIKPAFYNDEKYIQALAKNIEKQVNPGEFDRVMFSYHSIPERHIYKTDITNGHCKIDGNCCKEKSPAHAVCYRHQCFETTRMVCEILGWDTNKVMTTFQSRLGSAEWLKPYTAKTLEELPKQGIKKLAVITPAFVSDCLETIEEIGMEGREDYLEAGGESFKRVECLNNDPEWTQCIKDWTLETKFD